MDINSIISQLTSNEAISGIAGAAGVSAGDAKKVLTDAVPSLLNGALSQSEGSTAESFAAALKDHSGDLSSAIKNIDIKDGAKIISHLLGSSENKTVGEISRESGVSEKDTSNILSAAAPLVMSILGNESGSGTDVSSMLQGLLKNVDLTKIVGNLLGKSDAKDTVSNLLGGLFGKK